MRNLITAAIASALPDEGIPAEIVYLPEGEHRITPYVNGKAESVTVNVPPARGAEIAASLQGALDRRQKANVRPWFDFEHKAGAASALPKSFRYEAGKGIIAAVEWTNAGRAAVEGKDFSYFSPVFYLGEGGVPEGLPERGPLGGLVNEPAFREIPRIAASDAAGTTENNAMSQFLILATCGLLSQTEAAREDAESLARQRVSAMRGDADTLRTVQASLSEITAERDDLKKKLEASEAKVKQAAEKRAGDLVSAAAADGRIAPKDEKTQGFYKRLIAAGDAEAEEALKALPKQHAGLEKPVIVAGANGADPTTNAEGFLAEARKLVSAGQARSEEEAYGIVATRRPDLYEAYTKQFEA